VDGWGRHLPLLPRDGHPTHCAETVDLTGDARDETAVWDHERLWIYTRDRPGRSGDPGVPAAAAAASQHVEPPGAGLAAAMGGRLRGRWATVGVGGATERRESAAGMAGRV